MQFCQIEVLWKKRGGIIGVNYRPFMKYLGKKFSKTDHDII